MRDPNDPEYQQNTRQGPYDDNYGYGANDPRTGINAPVTPPVPPEPTLPTETKKTGKLGGGWDRDYGRGAQLFKEAITQGLTGEDVVNYIKSHGEWDSGAYYPGRNQFGFDQFYTFQDADGAWHAVYRPGPQGPVGQAQTGTDLTNQQTQQTGTSQATTTGTTAATNYQATTPTTTLPSSTTDPAIQAAVREQLLRMLQTPHVDAAELAGGPEAAAYRLSRERSDERQRAQIAEDAAYGGTSNQTGLTRQLGQSSAEGEAQFIGQLAIQEMNAQREDLKFAIQTAQQQGQFELSQALQEKLADLDAAVRREQIAAQARQAQADLELRRLLGLGDLGFRYANLGVNANAEAFQELMRGGGNT